ncbi:MAG: hypothetical protein ABH849_02410 [Nanoarchaeota archaeon]
MKKAIILIVLLIFISGCATTIEQDSDEVFCSDYDGNQEGCLLYEECVWVAEENICDSITGDTKDDEDFDEGDVDDGDVDYGEGEDEDEEDGGINPELEAIEIPNNPSNELCKKIPFSNEMTYSKRYHCLAIVNNDERFCEGADTENEKNICLAHANEDPSYCKKIKGQDANHVGDDAKHVCYFMLATSSENADFCSEIDYLDTAQENKEEKEECYYGFMSNLYQWGKSDEITTEICGQMEGEREKTCLALKARDISMCGTDPNCLTHFEQPLSFCDDHPNFVSCMKDRAKTGKDVSICELLSQPDRDVCVGVYCTHTELDVNICATIENIQIRQEFYEELAINLGN